MSEVQPDMVEVEYRLLNRYNNALKRIDYWENNTEMPEYLIDSCIETVNTAYTDFLYRIITAKEFEDILFNMGI